VLKRHAGPILVAVPTAWIVANAAALAALRQPWQQTVEAEANAQKQTGGGNLQPLIPAALNAAAAEMNQVAHGLTEGDLVPPGGISAGNRTYLFDNFLSLTPFFQNQIPAEIAAMDQRSDTFLQKIQAVGVVYGNLRQTMVTERQSLAALLATADAHAAAAAGLGLQVVAADLLARRQAAAAVVALHTGNSADAAFDAIAAHGNENQAALVVRVQAAVTAKTTALSQALTTYRRAARRVAPEVTQQIAPALDTAGRRERMGNILGTYGLVGYGAMLGLGTDTQKRVLGRWGIGGTPAAVLQAVPAAGANEGTLSATLAQLGKPLANEGGAAIFGLLQEVAQGATRIDLPAGVQAMTWEMINNFLVPRAFSHGNVATDLAAMKHTGEEVGAAPSKAKLEAYVAELDLAATAARARWGQDGRPAQGDYNDLQQAVARWHLIVKNVAGKAEIFHVDSGYAHSPWVNRVV
jgi:hypothetical protein